MTQTIESRDEFRKKHLATNYHDLMDTLMDILERKTFLMSELGIEMNRENYDKLLEKFETADQSCRTILQQCPHPSSTDSITDITHQIQNVIEKLRSTSLSINLPSSNDVELQQ